MSNPEGSSPPEAATTPYFNAGETELTALIMFVVDATRPFSVPEKLP